LQKGKLCSEQSFSTVPEDFERPLPAASGATYVKNLSAKRFGELSADPLKPSNIVSKLFALHASTTPLRLAEDAELKFRVDYCTGKT
jgi:hypothetical protein